MSLPLLQPFLGVRQQLLLLLLPVVVAACESWDRRRQRGRRRRKKRRRRRRRRRRGKKERKKRRRRGKKERKKRRRRGKKKRKKRRRRLSPLSCLPSRLEQRALVAGLLRCGLRRLRGGLRRGGGAGKTNRGSGSRSPHAVKRRGWTRKKRWRTRRCYKCRCRSRKVRGTGRAGLFLRPRCCSWPRRRRWRRESPACSSLQALLLVLLLHSLLLRPLLRVFHLDAGPQTERAAASFHAVAVAVGCRVAAVLDERLSRLAQSLRRLQ